MTAYIFPCVLSYDFEELEGSPSEKLSSTFTSIGSVRRFKCAYSDRLFLAMQFIGYSVTVGSNVAIYEPHEYEAISTYLIALDVGIEPFGRISAQSDDSRFATYTSAILTVTYGVPQREVSAAYGGNVTVIENIRGASEFLTLPTDNLYWGTGSNKIPITNLSAPGKISCMMEWTYGIRGARTLPSGIQTHPGKINSAPVYSTTLGWTFPAGTLLCNNPEHARQISFDGVTNDVTLKFLYKNNGTLLNPKGWNFFPKPDASGTSINWERITDGTNSKKIYEEADFGDVIV